MALRLRRVLPRTDRTEVDLRDSDLRGADLSGAVCSDVRLDGARWDDTTRWPAGFEPPVA